MKREELLREAIDNLREDRKKTEQLLKELEKELVTGDTTHSRSGVVAAKYVETLQRSNEQLVKIVAQLDKAQKTQEDISFSKDEKDNIFDLIQETI